jgi:hypothetical protein
MGTWITRDARICRVEVPRKLAQPIANDVPDDFIKATNRLRRYGLSIYPQDRPGTIPFIPYPFRYIALRSTSVPGRRHDGPFPAKAESRNLLLSRSWGKAAR